MNPANPSLLQLPLAAPLSGWGVIHVSGADAETFLHGQLTNDLLHLPADGAQWSAYCSPRGRMLAGFLVWRDGDGGFHMASDRALIPALIKRLRMFVLRAKVVIDDASGPSGVACHAGDASTAPMQVVRAGNAATIGLAPVNGIARAISLGLPAESDSGSGDTGWALLMIHAGEFWITAATQEQFVPQMVNFDAIGGLNFKKGCYPGQEVVARAHYRGAVKRRMYLAHVDAPASPGQPLFASDLNGQESGLIANAAPAPQGGSDVLAVLPIQSRLGADVRLGGTEGPLLTFGSLPYALPEAA